MQRPVFVTPTTVIAILGATIPGVFQGITGASDAVTVAAIALGAAILLVSIAGMRWAERQEGMGAVNGVMAAYGALVLASLVLTNARAFLVAMPYVSMLVIFLSLRAAVLAIVGLNAAMAVMFARQFSGGQLAGAVAGFASAAVFVGIFSLIARRERYARADIERLNAQVAELATAKERNRLARELHDSLGHVLTVANVQLEAVRAKGGADDERLVRVQSLLKTGLAELRGSVSMLREGAVRPLSTALEGLVADCNATGLPAQLTTQGTVRAVAPEVGFTLFRVAQEALTNVRRHAQATKVEVRVDYAAAQVMLEVSDDGVGRAAVNVTEGNGLSGLRERVSELGGTVAIDAPAGGGFRVVVQVPAP